MGFFKEHKVSLAVGAASAIGAFVAGKMFESEQHNLDELKKEKKMQHYIELKDVVTVNSNTNFEEGKMYYFPVSEEKG